MSLTVLVLSDEELSEEDLWPGLQYMSQVTLPKLRELNLEVADTMDPHLFAASFNGMESLERLEIYGGQVNLFPCIVEAFQKLESLELNDYYSFDEDTPMRRIQLVASHQNESLKKLYIYKTFSNEHWLSIYGTINACPNLETLIVGFSDVVDGNRLDEM